MKSELRFLFFLFVLISSLQAEASAQIQRLPGVQPRSTPTPARTPEPKPAAASLEGYPKHFFFTTAAKATSKVLRARDLTACISGDNANPSNKNAFMKVMPTVGGQKGRVIDAGTCDVVVLVIRDAEGEKNLKRDNEGFAVYKIVGDDLELLFAPGSNAYLAVGKMELANSTTLKKIDIIACGPSEIRDSYRPNPNTWKSWSNQYMDEDRMSRLTPEASPLGRSCDVWIMTPQLYQAFVKRFGSRHPIFDVSPSEPELSLRK